MTLSSVVVQTKAESFNNLKKILIETDICEYHLDDENSKIIITIEGKNTGDQRSSICLISFGTNHKRSKCL